MSTNLYSEPESVEEYLTQLGFTEDSNSYIKKINDEISISYNNSNLLKLDNYSVMDEIKKTNEAIKNITGSETIYLRPPYGNINSDIKNISNMYTILWDLDTEDWKYKDKDRIADYIVSNAHDGAIVLLHDLYETSVDGALLAMERLEKEGYAFVTIDEMIKIKDIQLDINKNYYQLK